MPDGLRIAGEHATARVPVARPGQTAGDVRDAMAGVSYDCADDVAVLEGKRLVGIVPIEVLMAAAQDARVAGLMDDDPPVVTPTVDQESVAWAMVRKNESSVAVVNGAGEFVGLVPPHRMVGVLLTEHDEDVARLGGYLASTQRARQAAEEDVGRRLWHRLPWLLVGLAGAMASAAIVGAFEEQLEANVLLAVFVPGVVYVADAVGTQTEALVIRGLSVGVSIRAILRREVATGFVIGLAIALAFMPFALLVWGDAGLALAVSLALLASCAIATLVAMLLPWILQRLGTDPARVGTARDRHPGSALNRHLLRGRDPDRRLVRRPAADRGPAETAANYRREAGCFADPARTGTEKTGRRCDDQEVTRVPQHHRRIQRQFPGRGRGRAREADR